MEILRKLFSSGEFMPHGTCYLWTPGLVWLHAMSDALIALAYYSIPLTLLLFVRRRRDLPFRLIFLFFGVFIIACGTTHAMEIWTLWNATYWLSGGVKAITAGASVVTALALVKIVPDALALPSPQQFRQMNDQLQRQIAERIHAEEALERMNQELEERVQARTGELSRANEQLRVQMEERERAEEALRQSEKRFRSLIEASRDAIAVMDAEGTLKYLSPSARSLAGYRPEELVGRNAFSLIHPEDVRGLQAGLAEILVKDPTGVPVPMSFRLRHQDGRWRSLEVVASNEVSDPVLRGFVLSLRDVTERKEAEESIQKLQLAVEQTEDAICMTDPAGAITYVNPAFERTYGYSREEVLGKTPRILKSGQHDKAFYERFWKRLLSGESVREQVINRRRDGQLAVVETSVSSFLDSHGKRIGFIAVQNDITERKRAEEALRASEGRYRTLFERNMAGVYRSTREGRILECNEAFARMFGYERDEILGHPATDLYPDPQRRSEFLDAIDRNGVVSNYEGLGRRKDDSVLWTLENAALVPADTGGGTVIEGTVIDVTERRQLEEQLRLSQKMEAVGQLAGGVAHDFNNLLTAILGYADILSSQVGEGSPASESAAEIRRAGERAASLTRQLLAFSRRQVLEPKVMDLNALAENLEKMLRRLIGEDVELVTMLDPGIGRVRADAGQIEQVVMNLAVNARDAMPKGGTLTIETKDVELDEAYPREHMSVRPGRYVMLAVSDTGLGMSVETKSHVFEPFFTTKGKGKGTGLGLATVYGIVKQSGGYIWVYSELDRGTSFKVYLPRVDEAVDVAPTRRVSERQTGGSETLLLVEDEQAVRALVRRILESYGYTVIEASGAAQALEAARRYEGPIHLILTDVVMPEMGGSELAPRVAELRPDVRVLFMSGYTDDAILRQGLIAEGGHFLQKPFTPGVLARKVRELLDGEP